jgi:succinoglycan biosynthesis transport protein ExoP
MDLHDFGRFLRAGWIFILAFVLVGAAGGFAYSLTQQPVYSATARVFVGTTATSSVDSQSVGLTFNQQIVASYMAIVTDPIVLNPVIEKLGLDESASQLASQVTADVPTGTLVMDITVVDSSAARSARIANAVTASLSDAVGALTPGKTSASTPIKITSTADAVAPTSPISPNKALNLALGTMVGLILGLLAAFLRAVTDTKIRSARDIAQITDAPLLAAIASTSKQDRNRLVDASDARSARGEAFRLLRTNLQFLDSAKESRSFVLTSANQGEGKTTTVSNLAVTIADTDTRVVLIDADLRRPQVHRQFGIDGSVGLTDVLIGSVALDDALQQWGGGDLAILPAGTIPPNPSELLQSADMIQLLDLLGTRFDIILLDTPPVVPVADAAILAARSSGAIMVVAEGRTRRHQLEKAVTQLEQVHGRLFGVVSNFERRNAKTTYGYGEYSPEAGTTAGDSGTRRWKPDARGTLGS